jgi:hypothetical protein
MSRHPCLRPVYPHSSRTFGNDALNCHALPGVGQCSGMTPERGRALATTAVC